ncbi:alpha/beta fold hydrolase [Acinetobacter sp. ANC 4173]|uniref:alpha/beta fold hydrolase n=1 Tax=Acinetobacter sp. ANC 4173 TaxID=2529837 RepID=UPI0010389BDA|nr:alpha/beta hydrolase [Acinetobacter sp. ANC 4173]TCB77299.1 alpha/beta hydrolase [Acinetobacter sp. ANC 4173]
MNENQVSVVLIPGFMLDESLWDEVVDEMPKEWNTLRANLSKGETIAEIAQNIAQNAPQKFIVIGFSLGGYIARSLAEQFPERVAGLILIASSMRPDSQQQKEHKLAAIKLNSKEKFRGLSSISILKTLHPSNTNNKFLVKRIQEMGKKLGYDAFVKQSMLNRNVYDMSKIKCPTLIISGAQDQVRSTEEAIELNDQILNARLETIDNTGHMIPIEQPKVLVSLIFNWLKDLN